MRIGYENLFYANVQFQKFDDANTKEILRLISRKCFLLMFTVIPFNYRTTKHPPKFSAASSTFLLELSQLPTGGKTKNQGSEGMNINFVVMNIARSKYSFKFHSIIKFLSLFFAEFLAKSFVCWLYHFLIYFYCIKFEIHRALGSMEDSAINSANRVF